MNGRVTAWWRGLRYEHWMKVGARRLRRRLEVQPPAGSIAYDDKHRRRR